MLIEIPEVLSQAELQQVRELLANVPWADGRITAGSQSAQVKNNWQLPEQTEQSHAARAIVLGALNHNPLFLSAALPKKDFPAPVQSLRRRSQHLW